MLIFGFIMIIVSIVAALAIGFLISKWNGLASYISFFILIFSATFGIMFFYAGVEKETLIDYDNGNISYKVTEIRVEDNKAVDIEVIYNNSQKDED